MIVDRRIWRRFLLHTGGLFALLLSLCVAFSLRGAVGRTDVGASLLLSIRRDILGLVDLLLGIAASLAMLITVQWLRASGVLVPLFAAGLRPQRIRRILLLAAVGLVASSAAVHAVASQFAESRQANVTLHRFDDLYAWDTTPDGGGRVAFEVDGMGLWRVPGESVPGPATAALPPLPAGLRLGTPPAPRRAFGTVAVQDWGEVPGTTVLATLGRWLFSAFLLLAGAYVALWLPLDRAAWAWVAYVFLLPLLALLFAWATVLLWDEDRDASVSIAAALGIPALVLLFLDRGFVRRGLRLSR